MWRNLEDAPASEAGGRKAMRVRLPPSASRLRSSVEEQRASTPRVEVRLLSGALDTTAGRPTQEQNYDNGKEGRDGLTRAGGPGDDPPRHGWIESPRSASRGTGRPRR